MIDDEYNNVDLHAYPAHRQKKTKKENNGSEDDREPKLQRVDLSRDERIFALLDEGCNRTCHTPAWSRHAEKVLHLMG